MSGRKGMVHYQEEVKRRAVQLYIEGKKSYREIAKEMGIRRSDRIECWVSMYRREGEASFHRPIGRPRKGEAEQRELERLRMENALLKKFRTELRGLQLAQHNIGRSTTTGKNSK